MSQTTEQKLGGVLKGLEENGRADVQVFTPEDVDIVFESLATPQTSSIRSQAFLCLTRYVSLVRSNEQKDVETERGTSELIRVLSAPLRDRLSSTDEGPLLEGLSFFTALFQVDGRSAAFLFTKEDISEHISDAADIFTSSPHIQKAIADVLAQASSHKSCRPVVASRWMPWLESRVQRSGNSELQATVALTLMKLSRGTADEPEIIPPSQEGRQASQGDDKLAELMKRLVLNKGASEPLDAVEGLAYMSVDGTVKEMLTQDSAFLTRLLSFVPLRKSSSAPNLPLLYGIAVIISNICMYRPKLSQEEAQIDRLKRMTKGGMSTGRLEEAKDIPLEDDESVRVRGKRLIKQGVIPVLVALAQSASEGIRKLAGKSLLSLVEEKDNRGPVLQAGGGKALLSIIRSSIDSLPPTSPTSAAPTLDSQDLAAIQALCKLAITASPRLLFGPDESASYDAIRPFSLLLQHPSASLLQEFEALMALTNLASLGPTTATRVAAADGLINKLEVLLLDDNLMVRRATTELLCNLISCDTVFERYSGEGSDPSLQNLASSRLHVLLALSDVEDLPTRSAASGALAMLTDSPSACRLLLNLEKGPQHTLSVIAQLIEPSVMPRTSRDGEEDGEGEDGEDDELSAAPVETADPGLRHRGAVCMRNLLLNVEPGGARSVAKDAEKAGAVVALISAVKDLAQQPGGEAVLTPIAETLKWLAQQGVEIFN